MRLRRLAIALAALAAVILSTARPGAFPAARAQELKLAIGAAVTSLDPHFHNAAQNTSVFSHFFDRLVNRTAEAGVAPGLAVSWQAVADTVWEFRLRPGVHWHDGAPFTADDVAFTLARVPHVPNSPASYASYLSAVRRVEVVDPMTVRLHTAMPAPNQPIDLALVGIVSRKHGEAATTADYNSGKAMVGTGPYRFARYLPGDRVDMTRNDAWWGPRQAWERVELRFIANAGARTAALLSGAVDMIDTPPAADLPRIKADPRLAVSTRQGMRVIFLRPDFSRAGGTPYVTDAAGGKLAQNPMLDVRVRRALSLAINRAALAERVQENAAVPTGQWLPPGAFGHNPDVKVPAPDPEGARKLLAEAGFPQGFRLTLHTPNDRFPNDAATAQAVAQMFSRVGVATQVEAMPFSALAARMARQDFSLVLFGWGSTSGEAGSVLLNVVSTYDRATGRGASNTARYSNPALDALIGRALATMDDGAREKLFHQAVAMAMEDVSFIPLYNQINSWAFKKTIHYPARSDERTFAFEVTPAQ